MNKIIKSAAYGLAAAMVISLIVYLAFAFGTWKLNPAEWSQDARVALAIASAAVTIVIPSLLAGYTAIDELS